MSLAGWREGVNRKSNIRPCARVNLTSGGIVGYYSNINTEVYSRDLDKYLKVSAGLESSIQYDQTISIWQRSSEIGETTVNIIDPRLREIFVADPILTSAEIELSFIVPGEIDWEDRYVIFRGQLRYPEWNAPYYPIKFRASPRNYRTDLRFPPIIIDLDRWPNAPNKNLGEESCPTIYGIPVESYCPYVDTSAYKYVISGHDMSTVPDKFELVRYDNISRQEIFSSECDDINDFETITGGVGTWASAGGRVTFSHNANANGAAFFIDANGDRILSYNQVIKTYARFIAPQADTTSRLGFYFRYVDANNNYYAYVQRDNGGQTYVRITRNVGGVTTLIYNYSMGIIAIDTDFYFTVKANGNVFTVYYDNVELGEVEEASLPVSGYTALYALHQTGGTNATSAFSWVRFPVRYPTASNTTDGLGDDVCIADFADNLGEDTDVYCSNGYGREDDEGNPITDFGKMIIDMTGNYSGLEEEDIDHAGVAGAASQLTGWKCSAIFNGRSNVFETLSERLCKQLPLIPLWKEGKFSLTIIDYSRIDVAAYLRLPGNIIRRENDATYSPIEDIGNSFIIKYQYSPIQNRFLNAVKRDYSNSFYCARSYARFGLREWIPIECYDIQDEDTANFLADFVASHYSWPQILIPYFLTKELHWIVPNDFVRVTDDDLEWEEKLFIVERSRPLDDGLYVELRSIEQIR